MGRQRTEAERQIAELLQTARRSLRLSVAFLSRLDGTTQHLEVVESNVPFVFREGYRQRRELTLCQAVLDEKLPAVIPDLKAFPVAMALLAARMPRLLLPACDVRGIPPQGGAGVIGAHTEPHAELPGPVSHY